MQPLEVLFESPELPTFDLPAGLAAIYGGAFGIAEPRLYANFVASIDGVTAIPALVESNRLIAAGSEQDRFLMGLLRACADAILIGAGTLSGSPRTHWTPEHAYPPASDLYAQLRRRRGVPPQPELALISGSGKIDPEHPGLAERAVVLTGAESAQRLRRVLPSSAGVVSIGDAPPLDAAAAVRALHDRGHRLILCEGGPTLLGALIASDLLEELFLTVSPRLAGRGAKQHRLSLIENAELLPDRLIDARLLSVRKAASQLFLRYALKPFDYGTVSRS